MFSLIDLASKSLSPCMYLLLRKICIKYRIVVLVLVLVLVLVSKRPRF